LAGAGENLDISLLRESNEEAGLEPADLEARTPLRTILRMHRRLPEGYQVEDVLVSDVTLGESVVPRNIDGEVSEIRLVSIADLWGMLEQNAFTREAELVILEGLERRMQAGLLR
jgi:8-oxo-dGTP pyrophosphatase MutT (NUDIX family)